MGLWEVPKITNDMDLKQIRNTMAMIVNELDFVINGNISSKNVREIGGFQVGQDYFRSKNGLVGMSSAVVGGLYDDVRYWAGSSVKEFAPWRVYNSGKTVVSNIEIQGGSIKWSAVAPPSPAQVGALPIDSPKLNNLNNIGDYIGALSEGQVSGLSTRMTNITSNGVYTGTIGVDQLYAQDAWITDAMVSNLSANKITTGSMSAARINTIGLAAEKMYKPGEPGSYMVVGGLLGDMILHRSNEEYFRIYNNISSVSLKFGPNSGGQGGTTFLTSGGNSTTAFGNWNFTGSVSGVTAKFS